MQCLKRCWKTQIFYVEVIFVVTCEYGKRPKPWIRTAEYSYHPRSWLALCLWQDIYLLPLPWNERVGQWYLRVSLALRFWKIRTLWFLKVKEEKLPSAHGVFHLILFRQGWEGSKPNGLKIREELNLLKTEYNKELFLLEEATTKVPQITALPFFF